MIAPQRETRLGTTTLLSGPATGRSHLSHSAQGPEIRIYHVTNIYIIFGRGIKNGPGRVKALNSDSRGGNATLFGIPTRPTVCRSPEFAGPFVSPGERENGQIIEEEVNP